MRHFGIAFFALSVLNACSPPVPEPSRSDLLDDFSQHRLTDHEAAVVAGDLAGYVSTYFDAAQGVLAAGRPACDAKEALSLYLSALTADGRAAECVALARSCLRDEHVAKEAAASLALDGARCAAVDDRFEDAYELFQAATTKPARDSLRAGAIFAFAAFAERSPYEAQTEAILGRLKGVPGFDHSDVEALRALLDYELTGKSARLSLAAVEAYVTRRVASADPVFAEGVSLAWHTVLSRRAYRFSDALVFVQGMQPRLGITRLFGASAHRLVVRAINDIYTQPGGLALARQVNASYLPHARRDFDLLVEKNPYTYSELYATECATSLLEGEQLTRYAAASEAFRAGKTSVEVALAVAQGIQAEVGAKADLLAFIGSLYEEKSDDGRAADFYWQSHEACPHYNRAHWGLSSVRLRRWQQAFPDYERRVASIGETLVGVEFPPSLATYVVNYAALGHDDQTRLKYSLRFWAPYVDFLVANDNSTYVKRGYELLSEAPGLPELRDSRIEYPYDNRLWDDVRGVGGARVVVDRSEMRGAALGAYNLGGHEVAHQWHFAVPQAVQRCIRRLYDLAKERGVFADAYAATNETEYFAQGVTYFMVPDDAPRAFGLTQRWARDNDPKLHELLTAVSRGKLEAITCPVEVPDETVDSHGEGGVRALPSEL